MASNLIPVQVTIENKTYRMDDVLAAIARDKQFKATKLIVMKTKLDNNYAAKLCLAIKDEWLKGSDPIVIKCTYGDGSTKSRRFTITTDGEFNGEIPEEKKPAAEVKQVERLREINQAIEDADITAEFNKLVESIEKVLARFEEKPELKDKNKDFYNVYIPKTLQIAEKFYLIYKTGIDTAETDTIKKEMLDNLDICVKAFNNIYESSYEEEMLDLSVDIAEIKAKLSSDGLTPSDFTL